jgi:hypothetical protein|tara:strand:- start:905 stop:1042 length:138 start_codon:yes stop_codon:yes gene_type:complete
VTIKPRFALIKILFNSKDILALVSQIDQEDFDEDSVKFEEEAIKR